MTAAQNDLLPKETTTELSIHEQKAAQCKERIENAHKGASVAFYDMAMGLLEASENEYPRVWGYENFSDYVEKALDMKYRTAYYMVEIGKVVRDLAIDKDRVQRIGWTKLKEIAGVLRDQPTDANKYLTMAESMSTTQLQDALRSDVKLTESKDAKPALMRMSLKFEGDSAAVLSDGLSMAYGDIGRDDASLALTHIVGEWLIARGGTPQSSTLEDWISFLKSAYGVDLVKAESQESIDSLLIDADATQVSDSVDALLSSADDDLDELLK